MSEIQLPPELKGSWEHALIFTYGLNIPFFEGSLLTREFHATCRNKIILADGEQYLDACRVSAVPGMVHHLNHRYIVEGIFMPHAMHAKVILLAHERAGRLLVGSGNLLSQGYVSGGELFTEYEYSEKEPGSLPAFLSIRELIYYLLDRGYVASQAARQRMKLLLEHTPWLMQGRAEGNSPVRHNLAHSFLDQLNDVIAGRPVEELWVLSPFFDREARALDQMLTTFQPRQATLLLQPERVSVDPAHLQRVMGRFRNQCQVCPVRRDPASIYLHAKMYLLKLANEAVCLQGSPNLSAAAILSTVLDGNVEVANLLSGPRDSFDGIVQALTLDQPIRDVLSLHLTYDSDLPDAKPRPADWWQLTGGELDGNRLRVSIQGHAPDSEGLEVAIGAYTCQPEFIGQEGGALVFRLPQDAVERLGRPVPLTICWGEQESQMVSNPIFVQHLANLEDTLEEHESTHSLPGIGDLDLDDEEMERLLAELDAALVIDRRSVWQLARRVPPSAPEDDDSGLHLSYLDINYDELRRHSKVQQYLARKAGGMRYGQTRLQIILNAIVGHFDGLVNGIPARAGTADVEQNTDLTEDETEEDREKEDAEKQQRRLSATKRTSRILKSFIRRYLRGLRSSDFCEFAGYEVVANNYIIFGHLLWRLFFKEWVDFEYLTESLLHMWTFFWGDGKAAGYLRSLKPEEQDEVLGWLEQAHAAADILASIYMSAHDAEPDKRTDSMLALRAFVRPFFAQSPLSFAEECLETVWKMVAQVQAYDPPRPTQIVKVIRTLADFDTRENYLRTIERKYRFKVHSCSFVRQTVSRPAIFRSESVSVLRIDDPAALAVFDQDMAADIVEDWMRFDSVGYYRVATKDGQRMLFYDTANGKGVYWPRDISSTTVDLKGWTVRARAWDTCLDQMAQAAAVTDQRATMPIASIVAKGL